MCVYMYVFIYVPVVHTYMWMHVIHETWRSTSDLSYSLPFFETESLGEPAVAWLDWLTSEPY